MYATFPDLLRLLFVPALAWAAYHDLRVRRVPNELWYPFAALGLALLAWEYVLVERTSLFLVRAAVSLLVIPLAYLFWFVGGFGGADFKAFCVVALLYPTYPSYYLADLALPLVRTQLGVFSVTVVTNAMLASLGYPLALGLRNALAGVVSKLMFVGRPVAVRQLAAAHGSLLETPEGFSRGGLDLDALRMYLRWRGVTLGRLLAQPERYRDPATVPAETNDPGDGSVTTEPIPDPASEPAPREDADEYDDPWGAARFLDDIDSTAYGTTPRKLREGLDVITSQERVWITPGVPFIVPLFVGLLLALTAGDLLFALMRLIGLV
ncbi:A24 family peptidase [Salarchaeum sp. JOR-1]|uniref:A24 family peptidase n=1 Tax=Salarchaeum sp. JOR-1 TaxID=2599399 RepID=UPI0011984BB7|nr:A24 family peptidase [Salarchaeum sp. JOR-1]QDX40325.1 prepilin peptidase [Salarchaeum sp. JOR-1]